MKLCTDFAEKRLIFSAASFSLILESLEFGVVVSPQIENICNSLIPTIVYIRVWTLLFSKWICTFNKTKYSDIKVFC